MLDYNTVDPVRTVMTHEMTHFGQNNTKLWDNFVKAIRKSSVFSDWVKSGYRYNSYENYETAKNTRYVSQKTDIILKDITEHYAQYGLELSAQDAEYEMYAKFCGECLFTTEKEQEKALASILEKATANERTSISDFIKKFIEWIKSKLPNYAPTLEQLENKWLELVKKTEVSEKENTADNSGVRYSIGYTTDNIPVAIVEEDILDGVPKSDWVTTVKSVLSEKFGGGIPISGRLVRINKITRSEYTNSKYSNYLKDSDE